MGNATSHEPRRPDRRRVRHEATRQEILNAAWAMVHAEGLASLSLRALARTVGMEPQSLYTYFPSKHAVYDAMFADGNRELLRRLQETTWEDEPGALLRQLGRLMLEFDTEDDARSQLLFDRVIPGFEPSPETFALAERTYALCRAQLERVGLGDQRSVDLFVVITDGLASQQRANDPGGNRFFALLDDAVDMYLAHVRPRVARPH